MKVKFIKLINNERKDPKIASKKACKLGAIDVCFNWDAAECSGLNVLDKCYNKDIGYSCSGNSDGDLCYAYRDRDGCDGIDEEDIDY